MRAVHNRVSSATLALYVGVVDVAIWFGALPFELYCRQFIAHSHHRLSLTAALLLANIFLLLLILSAAAAMTELIRRGFTRQALAFLRSFGSQRSKRSTH